MWNRWANRIAVCGRGLFASPFVFSSPSSWRFFSVSLFSLLFLFLFSAFLPQLSFLGFPLLCPRLSFSCALTAFLFRFQVFLFSVAALLGLGARSSAHGSPCRGKTTLAGGAALPMRAARARPCAALSGLFCFAPCASNRRLGRDEPAFDFPGRLPDPRSRAGERNDVDGRPMPGKAKRGFVQQNAGRAAASPGATNPVQNKPGQGWAQGNGRRRAGARGKGTRERGKEKEERGKERKRESMRDVLTSKKSHLKSWRHCLFGCRAAPARR